MFRRQAVALYCLCMGVALLGVVSSVLPILSNAEESLGLQLFYTLRGPEKTPPDVVVVAIDNESAGALGLPLDSSQWPRGLHARLIDRLTDGQAAVIAFDMLFQNPRDAANDQALATAMHRAGNIVLTQAIDRQTMALSDPNGGPKTRVTLERVISPVPLFADAAIAQAPFPLPKVPIKLNQFWCFRSASGNLPTLPVVAFHIYAQDAFPHFVRLLADVDAHLADRLHAPIDADVDLGTMIGMIQPLRMWFEENPGLATRALATLKRNPPANVAAHTLQRIRSLMALYRAGNSRYLNFYGPAGSVRTISYHRLMAPAILSQPTDDTLKDNAAYFVGQTSSNWIKTHDGFYTAFSDDSGNDVSGVEIAATALCNLIEDKGVYPLRPTTSLMLLAGWGFLMVSVSLYRSTAVSIAGLALCNGIYFSIAFLHFKSGGVWYPVVVPILVQAPTAFIAGLIYKNRNVTIERRNIREAFGYYLPDDVVDRLSTNLKNLNLGGQVFYGVCLFTDAQNYTTLSESMDPGSLTELMNAYYEAVFRPIKANGGLVLQVVGDSVMALWTASEPNCEIKHAACKAAVEITVAVDRFNRRMGTHAMPTRIGVHAGEMLLGNIGAMDHFEYRPVGDIVNTASRLEGLNKFLGTHVLVSRDAMGKTNGFIERSVGRFVFKGKSQPVHVHELLGKSSLGTDDRDALRRLFASGLEAFQRGRWNEANHCFHQVLRIDPGDGPSLFYIERCRFLKHAPPEDAWDGVVRLQEK